MRCIAVLVLAAAAAAQNPGYKDTPKLPNGYHVHDADRPRPLVVDPGPGAEKPTAAPSDAIVLFGGTSLDGWTGRDGKAGWKVEDGHVEVNRTGDIQTKQEFGDCQLHIEWAAPAPAKGDSQGRGNSGVFFFGRYEIQVLDCYENKTYPDGQTAAIYGQTPPLVNACRKPGEWQTYDIFFRAPRFGPDGTLLAPARATVIHNGVLVQLDQEFLGPTAHRSLPHYEPHGPTGPIRLQDHGDPVRFRNIWIRSLDAAPEAPAAKQDPIQAPKVARALADTKTIESAIEVFYVTVGRFPSDLLQLTSADVKGGPFLKALEKDPWGHDYRLRGDTMKTIEVISFGPDGTEGTADDISSRLQH